MAGSGTGLHEHGPCQVEIWIAMHRDLRKIKRVVKAFEVLAEALHRYLCPDDS